MVRRRSQYPNCLGVGVKGGGEHCSGAGGGPCTWCVWVQVKETELLVCEEEGGPVVMWVEGPVDAYI